MRLHKDFGYTDERTELSWGSLSARLLGTDHNVSRSEVVRRAPYRLVVTAALRGKAGPSCRAEIHSLELSDAGTSEPVFSASASSRSFEQLTDGSTAAIFVFQIERLEYQDLDLALTLSLTECTAEPGSRVQMKMVRNYQEKRIGVWEMLKGV